MHQTYELYLHEGPADRLRFEPLTCETAVQAMRKARNLLADDDTLDSVEVKLAGEHLFTLER